MKTITCRHCGESNDPKDEWCWYCGHSPTKAKVACPCAECQGRRAALARHGIRLLKENK